MTWKCKFQSPTLGLTVCEHSLSRMTIKTRTKVIHSTFSDLPEVKILRFTNFLWCKRESDAIALEVDVHSQLEFTRAVSTSCLTFNPLIADIIVRVLFRRVYMLKSRVICVSSDIDVKLRQSKLWDSLMSFSATRVSHDVTFSPTLFHTPSTPKLYIFAPLS